MTTRSGALLRSKKKRPRRIAAVSLERALSKLGFASRGNARKLIEAGRVALAGRTCRDPTKRVDLKNAKISVDGSMLEKSSRILLLLNKPRGYVTTHKDEKSRPTVFSLIPEEFSHYPHLHAVGRLDLATTGLLLLTNDTRFSSYMTDPKNLIERSYVLTVRGAVADSSIASMLKGISEGAENLSAKKIELKKRSEKESHLLVTLTEGKNREIRRLFEHFGHEVTRLKRVSFDKYELKDLEPGKIRRETF